MNIYTVTATGTYFVKAGNKTDAGNILYEALLGNDKNCILSWGEVHSKMEIVEGFHTTIERMDQ